MQKYEVSRSQLWYLEVSKMSIYVHDNALYKLTFYLLFTYLLSQLTHGQMRTLAHHCDHPLHNVEWVLHSSFWAYRSNTWVTHG